MKRYTLFNTICLIFIVITSFGALYFTRGYVKEWINAKQNTDIPVSVTRTEIEKKLQTSTPAVQIFSTSSQKVTVTSSKFIASSTIQIPSVVSSSSVSTPGVAEIPDSINLAVPFVPQAPEKNWDQPWQDACEEAAALMMDAYYKDYTLSVAVAKDAIIKMVSWEESSDRKWDRSIEISKVEQIFSQYLKLPAGRKTKIIENPTIEQIKQFIASGQPVYVVADGKVLPNFHFQNGGPVYHALVVRGYTKDSFITNDPGTQFGENFKYKYEDLLKSIRDWNGGDVKNGKRVILVLE